MRCVCYPAGLSGDESAEGIQKVSNELSGESRRSIRPHNSAALPSTISMDSDDEEVDDPGQGELGAVGDDEELGDRDDEDAGQPSRVPKDVETPQQNKSKSTMRHTSLPRCGALHAWKGRSQTHRIAELRIKAETSLKLEWTTHLCETLMGKND